MRELQERIVDVGAPFLPILGVTAFALHEARAAMSDTARTSLPEEDVAACASTIGEHDRLLLRLLEVQAEVLPRVRGLHAWYRSGGGALALRGRGPRRGSGFADFLSAENIHEAICDVPLPRGVPGGSGRGQFRKACSMGAGGSAQSLSGQSALALG